MAEAQSPTVVSAPAGEEQAGFVKGLGLVSSTTIVMGSMIGSGIFIVSAEIAREVGSPALLMTVWAVTGIMTLIAALSYGELAAAMPQAGGQYVYLRDSLGPLYGFLYGWTSFLVIQTGTIAAVAIAFAKYLGVLLPWVSSTNWLIHLGRVGTIDLGLSTQQLVAIASIAILTWVNTRGIRTGALVQNVFTISKVAALAALILLGLFVVRNAAAVALNFRNFWGRAGWTAGHVYQAGSRAVVVSTATIVFLAMVGSLFSSDAWNNITFTAGEVENPRRNIPLSLALGTAIVTALYLLANFSYLQVLPLFGNPNAPDVFGRGIQFATEDRVASAVVSVQFGASAAAIMAAAILISAFGCNNGLILAGARVYYAMARDGVFFRRVGRLSERFRVPATGLVWEGVWASLLCLSGTYNQLLEYVMFAVVLFYILTIWGLFVLRWKRPDLPRPYRAFGYPVLPGIYILLAVFFDVQLLRFMPDYTWTGLGIVLLGVPVYYIWRRVSPAGVTHPA
jgi:APA family basic amino acid/polyamine antiporter